MSYGENKNNTGAWDHAPTQAELDNLEDQLQAALAREGKSRADKEPQGGYAPRRGFDFPANASFESGKTAYANAPGRFVRVMGVEVEKEWAIEHGYMTPEEADEASRPGGPERGPGTNRPFVDTPAEATPAAGGNGDEDDGDGSDDADPELAAMDAAGKAMTDINAAIGDAAAAERLGDIAESGELPTELPGGVTQAQLDAVVEGHRANADHYLPQVGANVAALEDMLDESELRSARWATLDHDVDRLHSLGRDAINRLADLPKADPERFEEYLTDLPAEVRAAVEVDAGEWTINFPHRGRMSWSQAVRKGYVSLGRG